MRYVVIYFDWPFDVDIAVSNTYWSTCVECDFNFDSIHLLSEYHEMTYLPPNPFTHLSNHPPPNTRPSYFRIRHRNRRPIQTNRISQSNRRSKKSIRQIRFNNMLRIRSLPSTTPQKAIPENTPQDIFQNNILQKLDLLPPLLLQTTPLPKKHDH
jgi:hypothetical protein